MIGIARRRSRGIHNVEFVVAGAEALPFPDGSFDRVWTIHSFHHWEDPARGIAEARRVLRPDGRFLIVESESRGAHGLDRSRAQALAETLRDAGFADATVAKPHRQLVVSGLVDPRPT